MEEHTAVRQAAGLFDATHMGVFEASGPHVGRIPQYGNDNDVTTLDVGPSHYTYFLLPDGSVVDDLMIYRRGRREIHAGRQRLQQRQGLGLAQCGQRRAGDD
jgi:glycine hydroxymethyltransferase